MAIIRHPDAEAGRVRVTFEVPADVRADQVHLVGDFNRWNRSSHPMVRLGPDGPWQITIELERGRAYQYRYLVDGSEWQNDRSADRYEANPFGGSNSVIET